MDYATHNDRTAGSIPVWNTQANKTQESDPNKFGFADLIDIVNPLQHIPLVNVAYQKITGDDIKPVSQVVGGAVFGGAMGAGGAMVNIAIEAETGKDIGEHAIAMVEKETISTQVTQADHPEDNLNNALAALEQMDALSALAYTDLSHTRRSGDAYREPITTQDFSPMPELFHF